MGIATTWDCPVSSRQPENISTGSHPNSKTAQLAHPPVLAALSSTNLIFLPLKWLFVLQYEMNSTSHLQGLVHIGAIQISSIVLMQMISKSISHGIENIPYGK